MDRTGIVYVSFTENSEGNDTQLFDLGLSFVGEIEKAKIYYTHMVIKISQTETQLYLVPDRIEFTYAYVDDNVEVQTATRAAEIRLSEWGHLEDIVLLPND